MILDYNGTAGTIGTVQHVTVPAGVALMTMIVAGAEGQISLETGDGPPAAGGKGGRQTGTLPVVPGDVLILRYSVVPLALAVARNGSGSGTVTSSPSGIACGATCTANFSPGATVTLTAAAAAGSVFTGWLGACSGLGDCNVAMNAATTVSATFAAGVAMPVPDVDGDTAYDALTDGMLISRYLAGVTGDALVSGVLGMNATRSTGAAVAQFLDDLKPLLDIDGNGQVDAATDGVLPVRWLLRFQGDALVADAIGGGREAEVGTGHHGVSAVRLAVASKRNCHWSRSTERCGKRQSAAI